VIGNIYKQFGAAEPYTVLRILTVLLPENCKFRVHKGIQRTTLESYSMPRMDGRWRFR
jgi:hypothetical protein